tara:strand:+ start:172 stop:417 length:246 start_codon:yes stop_codon:yes gene_type:complete
MLDDKVDTSHREIGSGNILRSSIDHGWTKEDSGLGKSARTRPALFSKSSRMQKLIKVDRFGEKSGENLPFRAILNQDLISL